MEYSALEIASILGGNIQGDPNVKVSRLAKIEEGEEGTISFLSNMKYEPYLYSTKASIIIVPEDFEPEKELDITLIRVKDAHEAFVNLLRFADKAKHQKSGIESTAAVHKTAAVDEKAYIGDFVYVGQGAKIAAGAVIYSNVHIGDNVTVGESTIIYSGARLHNETQIGNNCIIHSNAVIGADGFGFTPKADGSYEKVPQLGNVIIEDNVEIGANTTIDRATLGSTIIRKGVKLDNLIQIAHNVEIGENTGIAAQTGIAGSTKIGKNCIIGGQVGIPGHLKIGDRVMIQAQSGLTNDLPDDAKVYGSPAMDASEFRKSYVYFRKFPEIVKRLDAVEKELKQQQIIKD